ncbi:MAG: aminoacyl-tRNA hydrolase [Rickettsia endosymbiont of Ixodes persulcatus]|nr:aminoacyl-tRNA hydrolase [Rickettsia endosymbiont of Ixodes persulcatus]MCZ6903080.1 aminoacyl-tRNA hydrolase [Rickettsia endosymbiont of Ixodes persulcatus]MCZ6909180.1 aminoacyl-tRNA hydrolase [Rickettsia endosymbiont of Ixodes persulcatus]MCZ6910481.1 aminoacyl-tRNA hydrolase [Rickettsia endosymbiont of Ixodes persulcatus]MCZ6913716.1 aminoacyl-tRNA hydrolase [Rickettsia endosymbiont of Ixodes persulcatus]
MILVIGLGNPGKEYQYTRHNIGFIAIEKIANQYNLSFSTKKKFNCEIAESSIEKQKLIFIKPTTYMNLSGKSVISVKTYYNIRPEKIFVIHDDIDLETGRIKFKTGGGNGGHNGLKSIDGVIGNNYNRIRIGVDRPQNNQDVADYVLSNFPKSEYEIAIQAIDKITNNFDLILENKLEEFKNKIG